MFKTTSSLLRNYPLSRTAGSSLHKLHIPHELPPSASKAAIIESHIIDPIRDLYRPPVSAYSKPDDSHVVFGNRVKRKGFPAGTGTMAPIICVDLFTMLDSSPLAKAIKAEIPNHNDEQAKKLAHDWRTASLTFAFRLGAMEKYIPFTNIIDSSLRQILRASNLPSISPKTMQTLTAAQLQLPTTADTRPFLTTLAQTPHAAHTYVFANAPLSMMNAIISANPDDLGSFFSPSPSHPAGNKIKSVDEMAFKCFKPHPRAYAQFEQSVNALSRDCVLVTSHPWDVVGGKAVGWKVVWVDRENEGWRDELGVGMGIKPDYVVGCLEEVQAIVDKL